MKLCQTCGQMLAEEITACPSCGSEVAEGRKSIDDYRILDVLHEGYASILCRAVKKGAGAPVMLRIFTPRSGIDETIAGRLKEELEELKKLPEDYFVQHYEIRKSSDGLWYRISEWIEAESWPNLMASGFFQDFHAAFRLFARITSILEGLHRTGHFIPHLVLYDVIPFRKQGKDLQVKIDYKLSRFLDPKMDRPGPILKKLLISHPDIVNGRPLDTRSDIWSLGKIFVELLTANLEVEDVSKEIEELFLPREAEVLIKLMLADDPDLRPRSMAKVEETLTRIKEKDIHDALRRSHEQKPSREIRGIKRWIRLLAVLMILLTTIGLVAWFYFTSKDLRVKPNWRLTPTDTPARWRLSWWNTGWKVTKKSITAIVPKERLFSLIPTAICSPTAMSPVHGWGSTTLRRTRRSAAAGNPNSSGIQILFVVRRPESIQTVAGIDGVGRPRRPLRP